MDWGGDRGDGELFLVGGSSAAMCGSWKTLALILIVVLVVIGIWS